MCGSRALEADQTSAPTPEDLATRLAHLARKIGRLVEALASGPDDLLSVRGAVATLERERARLEGQVRAAQTRAVAATDGGEVVDELLHALDDMRSVLDTGTAQERKALVRSFLAGIRVQKATRQAVLEWFRLPQAASAKLVELRVPN